MTGREKVSGEEHEIYPRCRPRPVAQSTYWVDPTAANRCTQAIIAFTDPSTILS